MGSKVLGGVAVVCMLASSALADDVVAVLVTSSPGDAGIEAHLNRELPAGVSIKIQVPVPSSDPSKGTLTIWSSTNNTCIDPGRGATQRRQFGMSVAGDANARVLEATISPLQIATKYCLQVVYERGLSTDKLNVVADIVAATRIDWPDTCSRQPSEQAERVYLRLAKRLEEALEAIQETHVRDHVTSRVERAPTRVTDAAAALTTLFDVPSRCKRLNAAYATKKNAEDDQQATTLRQAQEVTNVRQLPTTIKAWPAVVVPSGTSFVVWRLTDVLNQPTVLNGIVAHVDLADHALATDLAILADPATSAGDAAAKRQALRTSLAAKPTVSVPIVIFLPSLGKSVTATDLLSAAGDPALAAGLLVDLTKNSDVILLQLELLGRQEKVVADAWIKALTKLAEEANGAVQAIKAYKDAKAAVETAEAEGPTALKPLVQSETVKSLLRKTEIVRDTPLAALRETDDKASWISPVAGIMAAAPFLPGEGAHGRFGNPWLVPYVGASIYFRRVDRVIDLCDLVGDTFWQENSLSVGVLLAQPNVREKDVTGPWKIDVVPFVGFGHRFTQYLRGDVGLIPFQYVDRVPLVSERHWGVAGWIGLSLDADVWAVFSGKLGK